MNLWQAATNDILHLTWRESLIAVFPVFCMAAAISQIGILKKYGLRLKKNLGQHILIDNNIAERIADELDLEGDEGVVEIGPGLGALTFRLSSRAKQVVAVEIDSRFASVLRQENTGAGNVHIHEGNILKADLGGITRSYTGVRAWKLVGNLPYYITSAIIMRLIEARHSFSMGLVTVQEEYARRLVASPGSKDYSSLSILVQYRFRPEILFTVKPTSFFPRPDVRSAVVRFEVLERPGAGVRDEGLFFQTIRAAFGQRRKTLRRSLRQIPGLTPAVMTDVGRISGVGFDKRPEDMAIEEFVSLANAIKEVVG
jgi:16S rRNA (adenine1518-N6/adenine1519-N6)-dimethyltransferase